MSLYMWTQMMVITSQVMLITSLAVGGDGTPIDGDSTHSLRLPYINDSPRVERLFTLLDYAPSVLMFAVNLTYVMREIIAIFACVAIVGLIVRGVFARRFRTSSDQNNNDDGAGRVRAYDSDEPLSNQDKSVTFRGDSPAGTKIKKKRSLTDLSRKARASIRELPQKTGKLLDKMKKKTVRNARLITGFQERDKDTQRINHDNAPAHLLQVRPSKQDRLDEFSVVSQSLAIFSELDLDVALELYTQMERVTLKPNQVLFEAGDSDAACYFIQSGKIHLFDVSDDLAGYKHDRELRVLHAGGGGGLSNVLHVLNMLTEGPPGVQCVSTKAGESGATVLKLSPQTLVKLEAEYTDIRVQTVRSLMRYFNRYPFAIAVNVLGLFKDITKSQPPNEDFKVNMQMENDESSDEHDLRIKTTAATSLAHLLGCGVDSILEKSELYHVPQHTDLRKSVLEKDDDIVFVVQGVVTETAFSNVSNDNWFGNRVYPGCLAIQGLLAALTDDLILVSVNSETDVVVLSVPQDLIIRICEAHPKSLFKISQLYLDALSPLAQKIDHLVTTRRLEAGQELCCKGTVDDTVYVVMSGRLRFVKEGQRGTKQITHEYGHFNVLGYIDGLVTAHAIRDSELAVIPRGATDWMARDHPQVKSAVNIGYGADTQAGPKKKHARRDTGHVGTVAVVPISEGVPLEWFVEQLDTALQFVEPNRTLLLTPESLVPQLGNVVNWDSINDYRFRSIIDQLEYHHSCIVFAADKDQARKPAELSQWTRRCVELADKILLVGLGDDNPQQKALEKQLYENPDVRARIELVLLHPPTTQCPSHTVEWLNARPCSGHHHLRYLGPPAVRVPKFETKKKRNQNVSASSPTPKRRKRLFEYGEKDLAKDAHKDTIAMKIAQGMERLARSLLGKSVGLVLGGGGAKGFSHIGVIQALKQRGVPIDMVGGTSMGSFIGAAYSLEEGAFGPMRDRCLKMGQRMDYKIPQLFDLTFPVTSMLSGRHMNRVIQRSLEFDSDPGTAVMIEDLWLPYFCVTTNISATEPRIHTDGCLWRYVRASMSLSGFLPPFSDPKDGNLLVDGGYVNNLPVDVMYNLMGANRIMAVDVESKNTELKSYGDAVSGSAILWQRNNPFRSSETPKIPNQGEIQSRLAYITSALALADLNDNYLFDYFRPPIDSYGTIQFSAAAEIAEVGLKYGQEAIKDLEFDSDAVRGFQKQSSRVDLNKLFQPHSPKPADRNQTRT